MSFQIPPAFVPAELEYRHQRIKAGFSARGSSGSARRGIGPVRRIRLAALFRPRRRPSAESSNAGPRQPLPAPHHLASG